MMKGKRNSLSYEQWLDSPEGRHVDECKRRLIVKLIAPRRGEALLDIGRLSGERMLFFQRKGCDVTGLNSSPFLLETAKIKVGEKASLRLGSAEDLPFSDNEFDIVLLISPTEMNHNPEKTLREAVRVCRGRVFIGVFNRFSVPGARKSICRSLSNADEHLFHLGELLEMIRHVLPGARVRWGSVIFFPAVWGIQAAQFEDAIPVIKNPLGAFLGCSFPVKYTMRTVQDLIGDPFNIKSKSGQPVQGIVREGHE